MQLVLVRSNRTFSVLVKMYLYKKIVYIKELLYLINYKYISLNSIIYKIGLVTQMVEATLVTSRDVRS